MGYHKYPCNYGVFSVCDQRNLHDYFKDLIARNNQGILAAFEGLLPFKREEKTGKKENLGSGIMSNGTKPLNEG